MKRKTLIIIFAVIALLFILTVPFNTETYKDGGTKAYTSLTYKVVKWNKLYGAGVDKYSKTKLYIFPNNFKSIDELWEKESENLPETKPEKQEEALDVVEFYERGETFTAKVLSVEDKTFLVERLGGGEYIFTVMDSTKILKNGKKVSVSEIEVDKEISITYDGIVLKSNPGQLHLVYLIEIL